MSVHMLAMGAVLKKTASCMAAAAADRSNDSSLSSSKGISINRKKQ